MKRGHYLCTPTVAALNRDNLKQLRERVLWGFVFGLLIILGLLEAFGVHYLLLFQFLLNAVFCLTTLKSDNPFLTNATTCFSSFSQA